MKTVLTRAALCLFGLALYPVDAKAELPAASAAESGQPGATELMMLAVTVNGQPQDGAFLFTRRGDVFLIPASALTALRIKQPNIPPVMVEGQPFVALTAVEGLAARFDSADQRMILTVRADAFQANIVSITPRTPAPTRGSFAAFLNYDASLQYDRKLTATGFIETGITDNWGLAANSMLVGQGAGSRSVTRLDTYSLHDNPGNLTRLVIGDTVTDARDWSRQVRFGGARFGTEFGLQPDTITFPTPDFAGRTTVPSTVEVLVNNAQRFQTDVGQGPFSISQAPLVTGAGNVTLVIRDALGVERRVTSSYYVSSRLLRRGLSAWSIEAGEERHNYGIDSFDYGNPFAAGTFRRGITNRLTLESRAEISTNVQTIGGGANFVLPALGEFGLAGAASHGRDGSGALVRAFFSRVTPVWNVSLGYQYATPHFSELGVSRNEQQIRTQLQSSAGLSLGRWGNAAIAYTDLRYADRTRARVASANYSISVAGRGYLSLYALRSRFTDSKRATTIGAGLTIPFGRRSSADIQADSQGTMAEVRRTPSLAGGWGYRVAARTGGIDTQQAQLDWRGQPGEYSLQAARLNGDTAVRLLANGGLLFAGGGVYPMRHTDGGFAVVDVPGQADVRIYQENRLVARTDARGRAVVPELRPYEENRLTIAPGDLPLDVKMPNDTVTVVPRFRGAVQAHFDVKQQAPATVVLQYPDGRLVEAGSSAEIDGKERTFVGFGGQLFVDTLHAGTRIEIDGPDGLCAVVIDRVPPGILPTIGPIRCVATKERT